jgi:sugar phosphate isomerase/epimerase
MTMTRRYFLGSAASLTAAARAAAAPLGLPIGFQSYSVRDLLGKDFAGTLRQMASLGYQTVEMCSPPGYERSGFGSLVKMPAAEMRRTIKAAGLKCESCHFNFRELKENLDERMAFAKGLGLKQMILSTFGLKPDAKMSDWARAAEELNKIGERTLMAGMQLGFHNHNGEFAQIDGVLIYDELMRRFDAKLVKMQFQVAVVSLGYQAATYLEKYPGRIVSLHLADWSSTEKKMAAVGAGIVDWKKLFAAAKKSGVKNYFVEVNLDLLKASVPYLRALKV